MPAATSLLDHPADSPPSSQGTKGVLRLALPGILLAVVCLVPFLGKAFTIDDPLFLLEARQILKTPLRPWSYPLCWNQTLTCFAQAGSSGANVREGLMGYALVPAVLVNSERVAHLTQLLFVCVVVINMVAVTLRLGFDRRQAAAGGLLVVAIPPLLSMANTAMPDVLALALEVAGFERLLAWKEERRWHQAVLSGIALGLAPYARPHVALFLPLGALWLLDEFKFRKGVDQLQRQTFLWSPIAIAAVVLAGVNYVTRMRGASSELVTAASSTGNIPLNLIAYFHYLTFPIPLTVVWLAAHWRRVKMLLVPPLIPAVFAYLMVPEMTLVKELQVAAVLYGLVAVADIAVTFFRSGDQTSILLLLWLSLPLFTSVYLHLPLKYLVPILPAIVLIVLRPVPTMGWKRARLAYGIVVMVCASYSVLLLKTDEDFANYSRRAAVELIVPRVAAGEKVWYAGEWGFYWYAEQAGAKLAKPGEPGPQPGELLAIGLMENGDVVLKDFPNRELVESRSYDSPHGRTMGYGAGLYSNRFGLLPWRWNPRATNVYELWRIQR
jgi:hypothetical protein